LRSGLLDLRWLQARRRLPQQLLEALGTERLAHFQRRDVIGDVLSLHARALRGLETLIVAASTLTLAANFFAASTTPR
jgi:hypothetical protein